MIYTTWSVLNTLANRKKKSIPSLSVDHQQLTGHDFFFSLFFFQSVHHFFFHYCQPLRKDKKKWMMGKQWSLLERCQSNRCTIEKKSNRSKPWWYLWSSSDGTSSRLKMVDIQRVTSPTDLFLWPHAPLHCLCSGGRPFRMRHISKCFFDHSSHWKHNPQKPMDRVRWMQLFLELSSTFYV